MLQARLTQLLKEYATVKIATADQDGVPWVATAYFAEDGPFSVLLMLEATGRTLRNIRANPNVALMLENGDAMALFGQAEGWAERVQGAEERFRDAIVAKTPMSAPLVSLPGLLAVRATLDQWRLTWVAEGWLPGKVITRAELS